MAELNADTAAAVEVCEHYWMWQSPAGTRHAARLCMGCGSPNPEWLDEVYAELPDVEDVAAAVHAAWMDTKRAQGITSRPSEWGEEQMVPYAELSERAKDLDRGTVQAVYAAIAAISTPPESRTGGES